jgi:hypothetical protein
MMVLDSMKRECLTRTHDGNIPIAKHLVIGDGRE